MGECFLMRWLYLEAAQLILFFRPPQPTETVAQALCRARSSEQLVRPSNGKNRSKSSYPQGRHKHSSVHGVSSIRDTLHVIVSGALSGRSPTKCQTPQSLS